MTSTTNADCDRRGITEASGSLTPLPDWVNLDGHPEYSDREIEERRAVAIRGRAILPLVAMWVRDTYAPAKWPELGEFDLDDLGDLIRAHMGYEGIDIVTTIFGQLADCYEAPAVEADHTMDSLMKEHPWLFDFDNVAGPNVSAELAAAKRLCELHGLVVTEQAVAR